MWYFFIVQSSYSIAYFDVFLSPPEPSCTILPHFTLPWRMKPVYLDLVRDKGRSALMTWFWLWVNDNSFFEFRVSDVQLAHLYSISSVAIQWRCISAEPLSCPVLNIPLALITPGIMGYGIPVVHIRNAVHSHLFSEHVFILFSHHNLVCIHTHTSQCWETQWT